MNYEHVSNWSEYFKATGCTIAAALLVLADTIAGNQAAAQGEATVLSDISDEKETTS